MSKKTFTIIISGIFLVTIFGFVFIGNYNSVFAKPKSKKAKVSMDSNNISALTSATETVTTQSGIAISTPSGITNTTSSGIVEKDTKEKHWFKGKSQGNGKGNTNKLKGRDRAAEVHKRNELRKQEKEQEKQIKGNFNKNNIDNANDNNNDNEKDNQEDN
jgi:hypothetical protein